LDILPAVVALAVAWHVGLTLLERSRYPRQQRPSLARLLLLAEADLLRTLRSELKRRSHLKRESATERKLLEVEGRLRELGEDGE
jgi:hypothetical protein